MKYILPIFLSFLISLCSFSQDELISKKEQKKLAKEQKRAEQAEKRNEQAAIIKHLLDSQMFVLEADYISDGRGQRIQVISSINFVAIDSTLGLLQIGSPSGLGWNGVGGITVEGKISKYELKTIEGKRGTSYALSIVVMSSIGIYDVHFRISPSGYSDATVRSTVSGQLKYSGHIVPISQSKVYKGLSY